MILPADDRTAQRAFGGVVVERDPRIVDKARQSGPPFEHVANGFPEVAAGQADLDGGPLPDPIEHRARSLAAELLAERLRRDVARKGPGMRRSIA